MTLAKSRRKVVKALAKGQITIPTEFRRALGIEAETLLSISLVEDHLEGVPIEERRSNIAALHPGGHLHVPGSAEGPNIAVAPVLAPAGFVALHHGTGADLLEHLSHRRLSLTGYSMDGLDDGTNTQVQLMDGLQVPLDARRGDSAACPRASRNTYAISDLAANPLGTVTAATDVLGRERTGRSFSVAVRRIGSDSGCMSWDEISGRHLCEGSPGGAGQYRQEVW